MSKFDDYKFSCHSLGRLMSYLPDDSELEILENDINSLISEKTTLVNENGNKVKWTDAKEKTLISKTNKLEFLRSDNLPEGVISELDRIFSDVFWGRKLLLDTKEIRKGLKKEDEALELISEIEGIKFVKNEIKFKNNFLIGTPDSFNKFLIDNKCSYSLSTFDSVVVPTNDNIWQIKAYLMLLKDNAIELYSYDFGYVCYTLVNNPIEEIIQGVSSLRWKYDVIDDDEAPSDFYSDVAQHYSNMIYDVRKFRQNHPNFDIDYNIIDIPKSRRYKKFRVELLPNDRERMEKRLELCLKYLKNKELKELTYK